MYFDVEKTKVCFKGGFSIRINIRIFPTNLMRNASKKISTSAKERSCFGL